MWFALTARQAGRAGRRRLCSVIAKPAWESPVWRSSSSTATFNNSPRRFCAEATQPAPKPVRRGRTNTGAILVASATCAIAGLIAFIPDDKAASIAEWSEDVNEWSREILESIAETIVPSKPAPWLLDFKTMQYPDHLPTLIMDLDKVLVKLEYDRSHGWQVIKRPGADEFLKQMQFYYEIVIFSDDMNPVAMDVMIKWGVRFNSVLHREFCKRKRDHYIKDMSKLGRKPDKMVMLDHDPVAFSLQPENGIEIRPFDGDPDDRELHDLLEFFKAMASSGKDTREFISEFGGGDTDIGRRYRMYKEDREKSVNKLRGFGRAFSASGSGPGFTSGMPRSSRPF